jgi:hypothetical protein
MGAIAYKFTAEGKQEITSAIAARLRVSFRQTKELVERHNLVSSCILCADSLEHAFDEVFSRDPERYGKFSSWLSDTNGWGPSSAVVKAVLKDVLANEVAMAHILGEEHYPSDYMDFIYEQQFRRGEVHPRLLQRATMAWARRTAQREAWLLNEQGGRQ